MSKNINNKIFKFKQKHVDENTYFHFYDVAHINPSKKVVFEASDSVLVLDGDDPYNVTVLYDNAICVTLFPNETNGPHFLTYFEELICDENR